jgi:cholesterol transport system auxiliary component
MNIKRAFLFIAACLLTGCLARPYLDKQSFIFAPPPPASRTVTPGNRVIGIRTLQVAEPFEGRSFVYRTGEYAYDRDPYAEFMTRPADGLVPSICNWLRETGAFSAVVETGSALKPDTLIEIQVVQLYGDFRPSERPAAVLAMRFLFFDAANGIPGRVILQRDYSRRIPLQARTPAALVEGWNQALARILDTVMMDFGRVDTKSEKP